MYPGALGTWPGSSSLVGVSFDRLRTGSFDSAAPSTGLRTGPSTGAQDRTSLRMSGVLLSRWLRRTECVVELLLESCGGSRRFSGGRFAKRPYVMVIVARGLFRLWPVLGDFAEASIVEDPGGPEPVVAVGGRVVAPGDFE